MSWVICHLMMFLVITEIFECDQFPQWSGGYDARPDSKGLGFNLSLRHRIILDCQLSLIHPTDTSRAECDLSSCYNTHPNNERLGFDPLLRHRFFSDR